MRLHNIQFTSPEADRRVMLRVSFAIMGLFWIFCVTMLASVVLAAFSSNDGSYRDTEKAVFITSLSLLSAVIIPIQLVRYVRELRAPRTDS
jgi:hypothetical protein